MDVYLDNNLIYTFGHDYAEAEKMLPKVQHFINLPKDYSGKELKIVITPQEENAFSGMSPVDIGTIEDITRTMTQNGRLGLFIAVFLVVFGVMLLALSPILIYSGNHDLSIAFSGIISILLGLYILCFNDLFWIFSDKPGFYTFLEYISLFMLPAAILMFLTFARQIRNYSIGFSLGIINFGFCIVTVILHITGISHICNFVSWLHMIALAEGIYIIISLILAVYKSHKNKDEFGFGTNSTNILILGLFLFLGCAVIDIVKFNIEKFVKAGEVNANINFLTIGALIFMICLVLNYFFHCIEYINESNMKLQLEGLAYTDNLTGLANRSRCDLSLAELNDEYTIVSIDLDYLKYTNDNYGHAAGDRLLSGFAEILKTSFSDASLIGRMGGDEFLVILPFVDQVQVEKDLKTLNETMEERNLNESHIKYSASYGYATCDDEKLEDKTSAQNVYLLADARMYNMKNTHHKQSLGRLYDDLVKDMDSNSKGGSTNG